MGTSGNFSVVCAGTPLRLAITASGVHKGTLRPGGILVIDDRGRVRSGKGQPSAETRLHLEVVSARGAGAVLHTHSVWSTILSGRYESAGGFDLADYEMLKGLAGVSTHVHREHVPVVSNSQEMPALSQALGQALAAHPAAHAVLIGSHGLYTWGRTLEEAERHVEILEFLFEVEGRKASWHS
jgi:methylthioribulose-1-phosphate dehydratase